MNYRVDIGASLSGRTVEIIACTSHEAYNKALLEINRDKLEHIIQIRDERDYIVYSEWDDHGLNPRIRER
jgi:hypothetical protein